MARDEPYYDARGTYEVLYPFTAMGRAPFAHFHHGASDDDLYEHAPYACGGASVEYHTLYGVDRTRLTTRLPVTVLGKDSQYGRIVCGMCCEMSGPERSSRRQ